MGKELIHFGVKGMKWGVRKADRDDTPNAGYTRGQRNYDRKNLGKGGVKRVNRDLNKGLDIKTARKNEYTRRRKKYNAIVAGVLAARFAPQAIRIVSMVAGVASQRVAVLAETKRGQAAAAAAMGLPRTASSGPNYSKQQRNGVYNISSM